jgi:hypothetical protein
VIKAPYIPIQFHKLLKVVAIVDVEDPQIRQLLDRISAENFRVEISGGFERDVSEDASVGAYIAMIDGDTLARLRALYVVSVSKLHCGDSQTHTVFPTLVISSSWAKLRDISISGNRHRLSTRSK